MRHGSSLLSAAAASLLALPPATAQVQLYANGSPPPRLSTGTTSDSGVAAPAGTTWSEVQHPTGDLAQANSLAGSTQLATAFRLADDFTVPAAGWTIAHIDFHAYQTNAPATPSPFATHVLRIWGPCTAGTVPGSAGCTAIAFGDTTTNRLASSDDALLYRIFNSVAPPPGTAPSTARKIWRNRVTVGTSLGPGYYWLEWGSTVTSGASHFGPPLTVPGVRGLAGWNARQVNVGTGIWAAVIDTGNPATAPDVPLDFPFEIYGSPLLVADGFESGDLSAWSDSEPLCGALCD